MGAVLTSGGGAMIFNVLIKEEEGIYIAHCLELDIVATARSIRQVENDLRDLIKAQVDYAFAHKNLDNLYHPAPSEVWKEFYECKMQQESRHRIESAFKDEAPEIFVPPWFIARTCKSLRVDV